MGEHELKLSLRAISVSAVVGIFFIAAIFRLIDLDHIPGFYGDEAWYGIQATNLINGKPIEWVSPSNRPLTNFFFFIPILLLQVFFDSSLCILRLPAAISGILAVFLSFRLFRDHLGRPTAISLALLTATLPTNIAYSRFGWDPSILIVYAILIIFFAFRDDLKGTLISSFFALTAHPTALCIFPIVITTALSRQHSALLPSGHSQKKIGAAVLLACNIMAVIYAGSLNITSFRLSTTGKEYPFFRHLGGLFSGETAYLHIVDLSDSFGTINYLILIGTFLLLMLFLFRCIGLKDSSGSGRTIFYLGLGLLMSLMCGYLMTGPWFILPHAERYGVYLVFPCTLFFVILLHGSFPASKQHLPLALTILLSFFLLAGFYRHYFSPLYESGGNSHLAFRTGSVEPKQAAYLNILKESDGTPVRIFTDGWWIWQPFLYLAANNSAIEVLELREFSKPLKGDYVVTFAEKPLDLAVQADPASYKKRWTVLDHAGRAVLAIYRL